MPTQIDNFKANRTTASKRPDPFYRRFPADYQRKTRKLSLAARGAYSDIIDLIMIEGGPIPDDDFWMASSLHVKQRQWRDVKAELVAAGKIEIVNGCITNDRAEREISWREEVKDVKRSRYQKTRLGEANRNVSRGKSDCSTNVSRLFHDTLLEGKSNDFNGGASTEAEAPYGATYADTDVSAAEADAQCAKPPPLDEISRKVFEAAGEALADQAAAPGLASMSTPLWWIEQGCDLDRDVVPAITALALRERRKRGRGIRSWEYFTQAVAEAKAQRERGLPNVVTLQPRAVDATQAAYDKLLRETIGLATAGAAS